MICADQPFTVGWMLEVHFDKLCSKQRFSTNFSCLDRIFCCPALAGDGRLHTLILSLCAEFSSERTTAAQEHGVSGSHNCRAPLRVGTSVLDSGCYEQRCHMCCVCSIWMDFNSLEQWVSSGGWDPSRLTTNSWVDHCRPALGFLPLSVEHD